MIIDADADTDISIQPGILHMVLSAKFRLSARALKSRINVNWMLRCYSKGEVVHSKKPVGFVGSCFGGLVRFVLAFTGGCR